MARRCFGLALWSRLLSSSWYRTCFRVMLYLNFVLLISSLPLHYPGPTSTELTMQAIGSQANIGGAASAPLVAAAFNPALAPIGVLLAVLGYSIGTVAAYVTGLSFKAAAHALGVTAVVSQ